MGKLTTHVLDTAKGKPAHNLRIEVMFNGNLVRSATTNSDGRVDAPLLQDTDLKVGQYEILFYAGEYLTANFDDLQKPLFLDVIPVRFGISNVTQHYHVPLLLSPFSYSTYRGS
jgi:5-hydroxyisourate hydrolase